MWLLTSEHKGETLRARYLDPEQLVRVGLYRWPRSSRWYIQIQDRDGEESIIVDGLPDRDTGCKCLRTIISTMPLRPWLVIDKPGADCEYLWLDPESDHHLVVSRMPNTRRWELCSITPDGTSDTLATGLTREQAEAMLRQAVAALAVRDAILDATGSQDEAGGDARGTAV